MNSTVSKIMLRIAVVLLSIAVGAYLLGFEVASDAAYAGGITALFVWVMSLWRGNDKD